MVRAMCRQQVAQPAFSPLPSRERVRVRGNVANRHRRRRRIPASEHDQTHRKLREPNTSSRKQCEKSKSTPRTTKAKLKSDPIHTGAPASMNFFAMRESLRKRTRRLASVHETNRSKMVCRSTRGQQVAHPTRLLFRVTNVDNRSCYKRVHSMPPVA
jgi:hypothetical protein